MKLNRNATLILENGDQYSGYSFGSNKNITGEIVFNTAIAGYPEILTDPANYNQLLMFTNPLVGNYGVPNKKMEKGISKFLESEKIQTKAIIVSDYSEEYSHWNAESSLSDWLNEENIVGIGGIDTRSITKLLREKGTMRAKIIIDKTTNSDDGVDFNDTNLINQVDIVSCKEVITYNEEAKKKDCANRLWC